MSKYIDADKIEYAPCTVYQYNGKDITEMIAYKKLIDIMPTADVEEIKHGRWRLIEEDVDGNGNNQYRCSLCEAGELHAPFVIVPYCWKCGAKMDKEKIGVMRNEQIY